MHVYTLACDADTSPSSVTRTNCTNINECIALSASNGGCDVHANCTDTDGSRLCTCQVGFVGNGTVCDVCPAGLYGESNKKNLRVDNNLNNAMNKIICALILQTHKAR